MNFKETTNHAVKKNINRSISIPFDRKLPIIKPNFPKFETWEGNKGNLPKKDLSFIYK